MGPFAIASFGMSAVSAIAGINDSREAQSLMRKQLALQRESLEFAKTRYNEAQSLYGETRQKLVDSANEGVQADLQGVTDRAAADVSQSFQKSQEEADRNLSRYGINPNSGRAIAAKQGIGVAKAAAESGLINASRRDEKRYADDTTWNRRAFVGQMGANEINAANAGVNSAFNSSINAYGDASNTMQNSANSAFQTAGQFAGMGLTMMKPAVSQPSGTNPSTPTFMYPAGTASGPSPSQPVNYGNVIQGATSVPPYLVAQPAANGLTYNNFVARR